MKVRVRDVLDADEAIFRWSNLQVPPAMSMTLGLVVRAIRPVLEQFEQEQHKLNDAVTDYMDEINPTDANGERKPITAALTRMVQAKQRELGKQFKEASEQEVELPGVNPIKLSSLKKGKIVPTGRELALAWWLVEEMATPDSAIIASILEDFEGIEEAKSLKETHSHA